MACLGPTQISSCISKAALLSFYTFLPADFPQICDAPSAAPRETQSPQSSQPQKAGMFRPLPWQRLCPRQGHMCSQGHFHKVEPHCAVFMAPRIHSGLDVLSSLSHCPATLLLLNSSTSQGLVSGYAFRKTHTFRGTHPKKGGSIRLEPVMMNLAACESQGLHSAVW